jgi:hypothetical protein
MAYQSIDLGTTAGDGTGDTIREGGDKLNDNFVEIYTLLGTGTALTSGISATATIVTLINPTISDVASFSVGSAAAPSITKTGDTNTGLYFSAADALSITTGGTLRTTFDSTGLVVVGDVTSTGTVEPAGDTTAGDNASIGYTSAEGLILTGQGSTNDVTIKNDADADVLEIPTGTTNVTVVGDIITASTLQATGDTAAGDDASIGYTSVEGLILTGQGSTNDVTIKNDADADVLEIPTGTVNVTVVGDIITASTLQATGDTAAGDDAAIGYTSAEGLILTGQGSTNDVTIKNDADAKVMGVLTGTTTAAFTGQVTGIGFTGTLDGILGSGAAASASVTTLTVNGDITTTTSGTSNFVAGVNAGNSIESGGNYNVVVGDEAGTAITTGDYNVAVGYTALDANTTGVSNTALGYTSLGLNTTGNNNTAVGYAALDANTTADYNTAFGYNSLGDNTTGTQNVAVGGLALDANTTANANTAVGYGALTVSTTGHSNTAVGKDAGAAVTTGDNNIFLGHDAGDAITTGDNNILIGYATAASAVGVDNEMTLGGPSIANVRFPQDGTVFNFGVDSEVTLTHVADTGLLLSSTDKLMFNDASQFIQGASATVLDIAATDEIELTATLVDVNANLDVSGTIVGAGAITGGGLLTTGGNIVIPNAGNIGSASDTDAIAISSGGVVTMNQIPIFSAGVNVSGGTIAGTLSTAAQGNITSLGTLTTLTVDNIIVNGSNIGHTSDTDSIAIASNGVVTFSQAPVFPDGSINVADIDLDGATEMAAAVVDADLFMIDDGGGGTMKSMLASRLKTYIVSEVGAAADNISGGDAAINLTTSAGNITIDAAGDDTDIILKGTDGGADTTFLTIDGSAAGEATFNAGIVIADAGNIGSASDKDAIAIASDGVVTFSQIPVMPANSIDSDEYIDGSIDLAHMSVNSIDSDQYVDGSIDRVHLAADIIDGTKIADDVINSEHYAALSIDREHLAADIVDATKIADNAINSEHYVDGSIDVAHMAANSIDSAQYVDGSIDLAHMSANSIDSDQYVDGSIDTAHIAASQITVAKMATNSVDSDQYVDGSIDVAHMAANSVDSAQYVDNSIDEAHIANDAVGSAELKTLSTLLIKNSAGTTLKTLYGAGA